MNPPSPAKAAALISRSSCLRPALALVLGSGFHPFAQRITPELSIPYANLPGFPKTHVDGHDGKLLLGWLENIPILVLCGRAHFYEGHTLARLTFPIRVLAELGIHTLLLTNASGGINPKFRPGDFMALADHLNFMGDNPLRGTSSSPKNRFLDCSQIYHPQYADFLRQAARRARIRCFTGVYLAVPGPSYETPAEIRAFARLGADAVGMSTVPEAIVAHQCGIAVAAVACITNLAAGRGPSPLSHLEVLSMGQQVQTKAANLLTHFVRLHHQNETPTSSKPKSWSQSKTVDILPRRGTPLLQ